MHLFITKVDSSGRPLLREVVLDGPSRVIPFGGGGFPVKIDYEFDPPIQLPGAGKYFFAIKEEECSYVIVLLGDTLNPYAQGSAWRTEPQDLGCEGIGCCSFDFGGRVDLAFEVEFCRTDEVGVVRRGQSWGTVKARYR
jgi:hypothetical protein